jgi:hypothetical protein
VSYPTRGTLDICRVDLLGQKSPILYKSGLNTPWLHLNALYPDNIGAVNLNTLHSIEHGTNNFILLQSIALEMAKG